ncbi:hypothetical protein RN001_004400 [Aquatica leii]|uniref:Uncharacterized protein n=1 Tax=Aquatica leii TaxID=1421715 RepID=A0AAN7PEE8_9COLE|nr:hypothetical protein RN001_004400 [Aquatica leii]
MLTFWFTIHFHEILRAVWEVIKSVTSNAVSLMNNKLEVTAWKFFKFDMELLHSIIASITIYLVIMLQFDVEVSKKALRKEQNNTTTNTTYVT